VEDLVALAAAVSVAAAPGAVGRFSSFYKGLPSGRPEEKKTV